MTDWERFQKLAGQISDSIFLIRDMMQQPGVTSQQIEDLADAVHYQCKSLSCVLKAYSQNLQAV